MQRVPLKSGIHSRVASKRRATKAELRKAPKKSRIPPIIAIKKLAARLSERRVPNKVGDFYEDLMMRISRKVVRNTTGEGADLYAPDLDANIEVKGGDSTHSHRIDVEQLDRHHDDTQEFLSANSLLYCFFRYKNRQPNGKTGLMRNKTDITFAAYLFERVQDLWIIDHQILVALAKKRSRSNKRKKDGIYSSQNPTSIISVREICPKLWKRSDWNQKDGRKRIASCG